jgi:hypothetical protein
MGHTITTKYCSLYDIFRSAAVTILLLVVGVGVKRRADRRASIVHGTAGVLYEFIRSAAVTILLLVFGVGVKRRADRRASTVHGTAGVLYEFIRKLLRCRAATPNPPKPRGKGIWTWCYSKGWH